MADWVDTANPPYGVRICYFIPDAHHAIPFIDHDGNGNYTAPSWFDATMTCEGGTKVNGAWTDLPEYVLVSTQRGSITYKFEVHYEDTWLGHYRYLLDPNDPSWRPSHEHPLDPENPGFGYPHYALLTEIRDAYGNWVEYEYESFRQTDCLHDYEAAGEWPNPPCCNNCCQNCNEKGQIRAIYLHAADGSVKWTLLYVHRSFGGEADIGSTTPVDVMHHHMLHSIHVYDYEVRLSPAEPMTLRYVDQFDGLTSFDDYDAVEANVPPDWVVRAKYTYNEINDWKGGIYAQACSDPNSQYCKYANDILGREQTDGASEEPLTVESGLNHGGHLKNLSRWNPV